jgi:FMN phosphatase YigB (HAD superfamily)
MADLEKILLLFDWDDVIFNAAEFKNDFTDALEELDISGAVVFETYQTAKQLEGGYSFAGHAGLLATAYPEQADKIRAVFDKSMSRVPGFVFPDAKQLIIAAGLKGTQLGILTAGNEQFQKEKIQRSGLEPQFNFIKYISSLEPSHKADAIFDIVPQYDRVIFFEDRVDMLEAAAATGAREDRLSLVYVNRDGRVQQLPPGTVQAATLNSSIVSKLCFGE